MDFTYNKIDLLQDRARRAEEDRRKVAKKRRVGNRLFDVRAIRSGPVVLS